MQSQSPFEDKLDVEVGSKVVSWSLGGVESYPDDEDLFNMSPRPTKRNKLVCLVNVC